MTRFGPNLTNFMQNHLKIGWFRDIFYCQGFDFSVAKGTILALGLVAKDMVTKTRAEHPRQFFSEYHPPAA